MAQTRDALQIIIIVDRFKYLNIVEKFVDESF